MTKKKKTEDDLRDDVAKAEKDLDAKKSDLAVGSDTQEGHDAKKEAFLSAADRLEAARVAFLDFRTAVQQDN